ncbi:hypothetical protein D3C81_2188120 [compost metagenome]
MFTFSRSAIGFVGDDNVSGGQLVAEILIGDAFFIQQQARVKDTECRAQIDPRFVNRGGE